MVKLGPLAAEILSLVWGTPAKFRRVWRLGSVTARHSSSGRQPNFAALNRGLHNMVKFGPLAAEIVSLVWGSVGNFNGFRVLAALLYGTK